MRAPSPTHALDALDRVRSHALAWAAAHPHIFPWVRSREARVLLRAYVAIGVALVLALVAPCAALALGPLVLGVPHVAASVRYLVLRQKMHPAYIAALVVACLGLVGARVVTLVSDPGAAIVLTAVRVEVSLGCALAATSAIVGVASGGSVRRGAFAVAVLVALALVLVVFPYAGRLAFVHLHNLGVVALWVALFRHKKAVRVVVALFAGLAIVCLVPPLSVASFGGVAFDDVAAWLAPNASPRLAAALVLAHVYTDSIHYAFWLGVVPDQALRGEGSLTFAQTLRGLGRDFGRMLPWVLLASLAVPALAMLGAEMARRVYFSFFGFHGYVEGATLVLAFVRGTSPVEEREVERAAPTSRGRACVGE